MAAMSEKEPIVKYSWEGIKVGLEFSGMNGVPIDVEGLKFASSIGINTAGRAKSHRRVTSG